jgi:cytochrome P450
MRNILESFGRARTSASSSDRLPPGPPGYPLVGNIPSLARDPLAFLSDVGRQYSDVARVDVGPKDIFLLNHPDHIHRVLREESDRYVRGGGVWEVLSLLFGKGLAVTDGEVWKRQRRLLQPQFRPKHLGGLVPTMTSAIERELVRWQALAGRGERLDLAVEMNRFSMGVFLTAMFGSVITPADAELASASMSAALAHVQTRMLFHWLPSWMPVPGGKKFQRAMESLDTIVRALIAQREDDRGADDLLALLRSARSEGGQGMSSEVLRDEVLTFFIAGSETTATAMIWTLALLCQHPEVESRLREELRAVLGDRDPSHEDLPKLTYTSMVIQESMRVYPPVWIIIRQATVEGRLGEHVIPQGSFVAVLPHVVHRHRDFWSDPDVFDPERFAAGKGARRHACAYIPFGVGPHQCIGNNFALMEATLMLTMILQRFVLSLAPGYQPKPVLLDTMRPAGGLPVTLERAR